MLLHRGDSFFTNYRRLLTTSEKLKMVALQCVSPEDKLQLISRLIDFQNIET